MTQNIIKALVALGALAVLVVGLWAWSALKAPTETPSDTPAKKLGSGAIQAIPPILTNGMTVGEVRENWLPIQTIGSGSNQNVVVNRTGRTLYIDFAQVELIANAAGTQVASSTFRVRMFATSTETIGTSQNYTAPVQDKYSLVVGTWSTSTAATSTNSIGSVPLGGQGVIQLPPDWSLVTYLQAVDAAGCAGTGKCEAATSTKRGFDVRVRAHYHAVSDDL